MIKRYRSVELDEDDLLSDGMYGLARAVEKFNPWRGYRFSTYACNVIARALMRRAKMSSGYHRRFPVQQDASFERPTPAGDAETELRVERLQNALHRNLGELTELESMVLARRFPEHGPRLTYEQIGEGIGLSKERVRQIQNVALGKLREVLSEDPILK
jgi:RNA polymerase primary sigma factor